MSKSMPHRQATFLLAACVFVAVCMAFYFVKYPIKMPSLEGFANTKSPNKNAAGHHRAGNAVRTDPFKDAPMFVVNLDRRYDRLATTVKLLNDKGFTPLTRVMATDGNAEWETLKRIVKEDAMQPIYDGYRTAHHQLSKGGVGCYMSHLKLWNYLSKSDHEAFIIFEDDTFPTLTKAELMAKLAKVPDDWDFVLFGAIYDNCRNVNDHVCRISRFFCTHAYAIRKRTAMYMVPRALPIEQQIDSWMSDLSERRDINVYSLTNTDWNQNENINATDIQTPMVGEDENHA
jgi:GR25 family glycosyltransferase involved in LPS biosynthesis